MTKSPLTDQLRYTVLTPPGRAAVATIAVCGPQVHAVVGRYFQPASGRPLEAFPPERIIYGLWADGAGVAEELVVCRRSPETIEVHCHGGRAAIERIRRCLEEADCVPADATWWAAEQAENAIRAEAHLALATARTARTAAILLDQYRGALSHTVHDLVTALERSDSPAAIAGQLAQLEARAGLGLHLTAPWRVVLAGPANVGKSSLTNRLLGYDRSIVFDQPGTTRDVLTATTAFEGWAVELSDTAGLRETTHDLLERSGMQAARQQLQQADLVLLICDDCRAATRARERSEDFGDRHRVFVVRNKCDTMPSGAKRVADLLYTSAVTGEGLDRLIERIVQSLVPRTPEPGEGIPFTERQVEHIRAARERVESGQIRAAAQALRDLLR